MHLIVGLGNPGDKYRHNRHNIGFMAVDAIARRHGFPAFREKYQGLIAEGQVGGDRVLLLKPQTYMNSSGDSVQAVARFYKLGPADVSVIYDEIDLAPGKVRIKIGGGNGGHNGLRSIDPQIGTGYRRIRLGVGHPGHKDLVMPHVLGDFAKAEEAWLAPLLDAIADNAAMIVKGDDSGLMNKLAIATQGDGADRAQRPGTADPTRLKAPARSHVHAARPKPPQVKLPSTGPMADMLKKLFDKGSSGEG
ncbi:MAG: aminoacyl-tRNA hydrolase [Devosia sp.]|nr:aminoacyl-tRNA hydrolase [Devosia sp.]